MKSLIAFSGVAVAALLLAPAAAAQQSSARAKQQPQMDSDMQRAIAFQRAEDRAAARQARIEAKHPSVYNSEANRLLEEQDSVRSGRAVPDPGEKQYRRDRH